MRREEAIKQYGVYYKIPNLGISNFSSVIAQECLGDIDHHKERNPGSLVFSSEDDIKDYLHHIRNISALKELTKAVSETSKDGLSRAFTFIKKIGNSDDKKWNKFKKAQKILERVDNILSSNVTKSHEDRLSTVENEKRFLKWIYNRENITQIISEMCKHYEINFSNPDDKNDAKLDVIELPKKIDIANKMTLTNIFVMSSAEAIIYGEKPAVHSAHIEFDYIAKTDGRITGNDREKESYGVYYKCSISDKNNIPNNKVPVKVIDHGSVKGLEARPKIWRAFLDRESITNHFEEIRSNINGVCDDLIKNLHDLDNHNSTIVPIDKLKAD